ncbi:MAG: OmpA family protein [Saprospiraceae bacterium]|nr:OmpA family protein [Saprospiraceae bacterium]
MKISIKPILFENKRQEIVFMIAFMQMLLLLMAFLFMQCKKAEKLPSGNSPSESTAAVDTSQKATYLVDTNYVPIAYHHPETVKQTLKNLEALHFTEGGIAAQVLDYLKRGDNDFGEDFKFIYLQFKGRTAEIIEKFNKEIPELANIMNSFPNLKVRLMAYTDDIGDEKANEILAEKRAKAIQNQLVAAGIATDRIQIKSFGEKYPVANNKTFDGQMLNNRIEMLIISKF